MDQFRISTGIFLSLDLLYIYTFIQELGQGLVTLAAENLYLVTTVLLYGRISSVVGSTAWK